MKKYTDLYVVCKYERWSQYWFKSLLNYILAYESSELVARYNSRERSITLTNHDQLYTVRFVSENWFEKCRDGHDCVMLDWCDGEVKDLYVKIRNTFWK